MLIDTEAPVELSDALSVIMIAIATSFLAEGFSWVMIYRTERFRTLRADAEELLDRIEKDKRVLNSHSKGYQKQTKKIKMDESRLKRFGGELSRAKMKSNFVIAIFMITFMSFLSETFQGVVVAKLPFTPFSMMRGITHRNLVGSEFTECSMTFLYILANVCFRPMIQKFLGFDGPRGLQQNNMFPGMQNN